MRTSEQINELAAALAKAQGLIEGAKKGNTNPAFRSKYADLGAVWDAIREPLASNGLSVIQQMTSEPGTVACTTLLMHQSGQFIQFAPFVVPVGKPDAQGYGSAATYCRRYSLMAAVGIAPVDDDGEAAVGRNKQAREPQAPQVPDGLLEAAQNVALEGTEALRAYWERLSPAYRDVLAPQLRSLKAAAAAVDSATPEVANAD